jgi:protein-tyrosine-phosphatase
MQILFVCTGNTCRSPLAAAIASRAADEHGLTDLAAASAGTSAAEGQPASDGALLVGIERHLDIVDHRARQLTRELVEQSDLILVMGPHHLDRVDALGGAGKAHLLTDYASHGTAHRPVSDPFGGELDVYRTTVDELEAEIRHAIGRVVAERTRGAS